jgi:hypothetical protein
MNYSDDELQDRVEKGVVDPTADARAYQKIFDALKKEPYHLPDHFADKVVDRALAQRGLSKDYFWFGMGLFSFVVATIIAIRLTDFNFSFGALKFISGYSGLFTFALAFILLIQYIDRQFIKGKMSA